MKKLLIAFVVMGFFASCEGINDNPGNNNSPIKEPEMGFGQTTKATLERDLGAPNNIEDTTLVANVSVIESILMSFTSPYGTNNVSLLNREVEVLQYEGQTPDEVSRTYVMLNNKLAGSIIVYHKNSAEYTDKVEAYLEGSSRNYVGIKVQNLYNVFGFNASDVDEEHQYLLTWLNSALYIAQQNNPAQDASYAEQWLSMATGYNLVAYGGIPAKDPQNEYSMLTFVDVRAIYEFAHFSDIFGFLDFVLDMTF